VDDEPAILRLAIRAVRGQGCGVLWADNGADAFELARTHHPDLVLTDALMPRLDGRELCRTLKSDPDLRGIKVVVMTGVYTTTMDAHQGRLEYGVDDYLAKPIDFVELGLLLKKHTEPGVSNS
jgi:CheY-like chemotaxis protein